MGRRRLTESESERVESILSEHRVFVTAVARKFTRKPEDVPDVLQRARLDIARGFHKFQSRSKVTTWLHQVVANAARMNNRTEARHRRRCDTYRVGVVTGRVTVHVNGPDQHLEQRERMAALVRKLEAEAAAGIISTDSAVRARARRIREVLADYDANE